MNCDFGPLIVASEIKSKRADAQAERTDRMGLEECDLRESVVDTGPPTSHRHHYYL